MKDLFFFDVNGFFTFKRAYPDGVNCGSATEVPIPDTPLITGNQWRFNSGEWVQEIYFAPQVSAFYGRTITVLAYRSRFMPDEKAMLNVLSIHDSAIEPTDPANLNRAKVREAFTDLNIASKVELDDDRTQAGAMAMCTLLEAAGLVADKDERYSIIINTDAAWSELREIDQAKYPQP